MKQDALVVAVVVVVVVAIVVDDDDVAQVVSDHTKRAKSAEFKRTNAWKFSGIQSSSFLQMPAITKNPYLT